MDKIRQGDEIIVIAGKEKGKLGKVVKKLNNDKLVIDGVNTVKKHQRGNPNLGIAGGIVEKNMPIHISNVAIYNPKTKKADRVGFKTLDSGKKVRLFKSTSEVVDL
ncbi:MULTISPECIES: 50S ribosomal protein L24 [Methylomonas]|uniref:50S ribosomal protein L24 n=1 Tax=Methylomonas TaxID=416 RepID=UPI001231A9FC|nr:50S ribosomal protein L24 [Methylomonas rhizoryzae]